MNRLFGALGEAEGRRGGVVRGVDARRPAAPSRVHRRAGRQCYRERSTETNLRTAEFTPLLLEVASPLQSLRLMDNHSKSDPAQPGLQRDPDEWKTGDEPMTEAQRSYLKTLCDETNEEFDDSLTKAEASKRIDDLRARSPRLADET